MSEETPILAYTLGVDLGQSQDFTVAVLIEQEIGKKGFEWTGFRYQEFEREYAPEEFIYRVIGLKRLELGTPYPDQVKEVERILKGVAVAGKGFARHNNQARLFLGLDRGGCGRPVVDLFEQAELNPIGITITGGDTVTNDGNHYRVPKRELVNLTKVLLQSGRLKISKNIPEYAILTSELNNFKYKINDNANDVYGATAGTHDDAVLALAVGLWVAEKQINNEIRRLGPGDVLYDFMMELPGYSD